MAYFSNGTEGELYREQYCARCVHEPTCPVWLLHLTRNYAESNNPDSILHVLIPMRKDGFAGKCTMFVTAEQVRRIRNGADRQMVLMEDNHNAPPATGRCHR